MDEHVDVSRVPPRYPRDGEGVLLIAGRRRLNHSTGTRREPLVYPSTKASPLNAPVELTRGSWSCAGPLREQGRCSAEQRLV